MSFRQGSNVEFGGVAEPAYTLEETGARKGRDFSNPMYEAVTRAGPPDAQPPLRKSEHQSDLTLWEEFHTYTRST